MTLRLPFPHLLAVAALIVVAALAIAVPSLGADPPGTWDETLADVPSSRQEVSYVRVGTTLYLAGGDETQRSYNTVTDTWNDPEDAPLPELADSLDHIQGVAVGGKIYYIGGLDMSAEYPLGEVGTVQIFDPATGTMTSGAPMPAGRARGAGAVAVFDGLIYYFGGLNGGSGKAWVDVYDPVEDEWTSLSDIPGLSNGRDHTVAVPLGGLIHLIGGRGGPDFATTSGSHRTYNPATDTWTTGLAALQTARGGHAAVVLGGEIVVIGGEAVGGTTPAIARVEAYNPATNSWRDLASMPAPRHGIQAAVCSGSIYVAAGGTTAGFNPTAAHDRFTLGSFQDCANAVPSCASSALTTGPDTPVSADLNCTDGDGDALAYSIVTPPGHGTIEGADAGGGFTYTPAPGFEGADSFTVRATDGQLSPPATISVQVEPIEPGPALQIAPASLDFGSRDVDSGPSSPQTLTLGNSGGGQISVAGATLAGSGSGDFAVVADGCAGQSLAAAETCEISLTFDPNGAGPKEASVSIASSAPGSPQVANLSGTGTSAGPPPLLRGACANRQTGTPEPDRLTGTRFGDSIAGFGGADVLRGAAASDCLKGGRGDDDLFGGRGADTVTGGRGGNSVQGGAGADLVNVANARHDAVNCGSGRDVARADPGDRLVNCERVRPG